MSSAETKSDPHQTVIGHLQSRECLRNFSCGEHDIDRWAKEKAHKFHEKRRARVFCARNQGIGPSLGFYSLSLFTEQQAKIAPVHRDAWPNGAPLVYIDFIAVSQARQNCGIGKLMLINALKNTYDISKVVAPYGLALRSLNTRTTELYEKFGFGIAPGESEATSPLMILPIWSIVQLFET